MFSTIILYLWKKSQTKPCCCTSVFMRHLTLLQSCSQQHGSLRQLLRVRLNQQTRFDQRRVRPPTQCWELCVNLQLVLQAGADLLVLARQTLWNTSSHRSETDHRRNVNSTITGRSKYPVTYKSSEHEPQQLASPLRTHSCIPPLPLDSWSVETV